MCSNFGISFSSIVIFSGWVAQDDALKIVNKLAMPALNSAVPLLIGFPFRADF